MKYTNYCKTKILYHIFTRLACQNFDSALINHNEEVNFSNLKYLDTAS